MFKALFLDLDETLCDTTGANLKARDFLAGKARELFDSHFDAFTFSNDYLTGIYKIFTPEMKEVFLPINNEEIFRRDLLKFLLRKHNVATTLSDGELDGLRMEFDDYRMLCFDFFPGVKDLIRKLKNCYKLVVITNGPIYSQHPKVNKVQIRDLVDHVIIGGEEPEEKPHQSIFIKACRLADCSPGEAIHVGDSLPADIAGAVNAGIKSVWISPEMKDDPLPDHIIPNIIHLPEVLKEYR